MNLSRYRVVILSALLISFSCGDQANQDETDLEGCVTQADCRSNEICTEALCKTKPKQAFENEKCFDQSENRSETCEVFTVAELIYEFDSNPIRAEKILVNREVIIKGEVDVIRGGFLADYIIELSGGIDLGVDESQEDEVIKMDIGDNIYCKGYPRKKFINPCFLLDI